MLPGMGEAFLPHRRSWKLAVALAFAAVLISPAPLGRAEPLPPPNPPSPSPALGESVSPPSNRHHRRHRSGVVVGPPLAPFGGPY